MKKLRLRIIAAILCIALYVPLALAASNPYVRKVSLSEYANLVVCWGNITSLEFIHTTENHYQVTAEVQYKSESTVVKFECDFYKFGTDDMITYNKIIGDVSESIHDILNFSICINNDVLTPDIILEENYGLVKLAFVLDEKTAIRANIIISSDDVPVIPNSFSNETQSSTAHYNVNKEDALDALKTELRLSETWAAAFGEENFSAEDTQLSEPNSLAEGLFEESFEESIEQNVDINQKLNTNIEIEYHQYQPYGNYLPMDNGEQSPPAPKSIVGDTHMIVNNIFNESILKSAGCRTGLKSDTSGRVYAGYHTDTYYDSWYGYLTNGAIWNFNYSVSSVSGASTQRISVLDNGIMRSEKKSKLPMYHDLFTSGPHL